MWKNPSTRAVLVELTVVLRYAFGRLEAPTSRYYVIRGGEREVFIV